MSLKAPMIEQTINQELVEIISLLPTAEQNRLHKTSLRLIKILELRLKNNDSYALEASAHFLNKWLKKIPHLSEASRVYLGHTILKRLGQRANIL